jgi:hypothetical protein
MCSAGQVGFIFAQVGLQHRIFVKIRLLSGGKGIQWKMVADRLRIAVNCPQPSSTPCKLIQIVVCNRAISPSAPLENVDPHLFAVLLPWSAVFYFPAGRIPASEISCNKENGFDRGRTVS